MKERLKSFFSNVLAVAYKEAVVVRNDKAFVAMVFAQPIMMLLLFGFALTNEPKNVPWVVFDMSQTALSRRFLEDVFVTGYFERPRPVESYDEGRRWLSRGDAIAFVVVPEDFARDALRGRPEVQLLVDGSDPLTSARVSAYIGQVASGFDPLQGRRGAFSRVDAPEIGASQPSAALEMRQRFEFNPTLRDRDFFLAALAGMLLTNLCLSASSLGLVGERENGTYEQMLALPTSPLEIVLGKLVPHAAVAYLVLSFAIVLPGIVFGMWPTGSWLALYLVTLPFVLASLAIGVFVSALARTTAQAVFITVFFILPSFVLSGTMFPYQLMPDGVRQLGGLLPLRWYQIALRRIIERGAGIGEVGVPLLALLAIFLVLLGAVRRVVKPRLG
ncbi:MAG TPA: ABC transporter permease [Myxococcota bacterium]|nr:ABC transporter permease [Myxococcota bacterium]